jgi:hypothetical protein
MNPAPQPKTDRAARLFPESEYLQREWRRAVAVVRKTRRGYLLDRPVPKQEKPQ